MVNIVARLRCWFGFRQNAIRVVAEQPLFAGTTVHVIDVDTHRIVFAAAPRAICMLARYRLDSASRLMVEEEGAQHRV